MSDNPYEPPETVSGPAQRKTSATAFAIRALFVVAILVVLVALLLPASRSGGREASRRMQCSNHLKQIALALQNYHDTYGGLPPAYTVDAAGNRLHSWRTLILPFAEHKPLYDQIDFSKPWDDPANKAAHETIPAYFRCPTANLSNRRTSYLAIATADGCFKPTESRRFSEITDDKNLTLMVLEVPDEYAVHWMSPSDIDDELFSKLAAAKKPPHANGSLGVFVSGYVRHLAQTMPAKIIRALVTIAGDDDQVAESVN